MQNGDGMPTAAVTLKKKVPEEMTKHSYRLKVWRHLENNGLAMFPRPVYNRIPNFKGAVEAAAKLSELDVFKNAKSIKVNPDKPQEPVRVLCLEQQKTLYVPVLRLQNGFLSRLELPGGEIGPTTIRIRKAVSRNGMETYGKPTDRSKEPKNDISAEVGEEFSILQIPDGAAASSDQGIEDTVSLDLVVVGSVAVSKEGYHIGKGKGYGDLEFGLMMHMEAIKPNTLVVTTVHDSQVFDTLPAELFGPHDIPIDIIITPTQVIETQRMSQRPVGILWNILSNRRLQLMPILGQLRGIEILAGQECELKETDTDVEERTAQRPRRIRRRTRSYKSHSEGEGNTTEGEDGKVGGKPRKNARRRNSHKSTGKEGKEGEVKPRRPKRQRPVIDFSVKISNISPNTRVRDLKQALSERGVKPQIMVWKGFRGFCYLHFFKTSPQKGEGDNGGNAGAAANMDSVLAALAHMSLGGSGVANNADDNTAPDEKPRLLNVEPAPPRHAHVQSPPSAPSASPPLATPTAPATEVH